ncbi:MAG: SPOR domain-containing protein [Candidatus Eisenbacteria bacterium]|nr:SPOR domain-containing protein [Candidatus Eisenbacteria bacterium]
MTRRCLSYGVLPALLFAAHLIAVPDARASFVVSPMELHLRAGPGGRAEEPITIKNTGTRPLSVRLYPGDSRFGLDGREENLPVGSLARSCADWLTVDGRVIDLEPGEVRQIPILLEAPSPAVGSYWTKVYLEEVSAPEPSVVKEGERTYRVFIKQRVGVRIFEDVEGTLRPAARVTHVGVEAPEIREAAVTPETVSPKDAAPGSWRAQLLATRDAGKARGLAESLAGRFDGPVHVVFDDPFYKVQVGEERTREEAEVLTSRLASTGFGSSWIVRASVASPAGAKAESRADAPAPAARTETVDGFRVQLLASADEKKARALAERAEAVLETAAYVERSGALFKTRVGNCEEKEDALRLVERAKRSGFGGAWLVRAEVTREAPLLASVPETGILPPTAEEPAASASLDHGRNAAPWTPVVTVRVENTGNSILRCTGRAEIRDGGGAALDTLALGVEGRFTLFPGGTRELRVSGDRDLAPGTYTALAIVDFGGDYLVAGDAVFEVPDRRVLARSGPGAIQGDGE